MARRFSAAIRPRATRLPLALLRDACGCFACRDARTGQRRANTLAACAVARRVVRAEPSGALRVIWHDAHESTFSATDLAVLAREEEAPDAATDARARRLFRACAEVPEVAHAAWMRDDAALLLGLKHLRDVGLVRVEGVPVTESATEEALRRIAEPLATIYGRSLWRTEVLPSADPRNTDSAFSRAFLPPHTDGCYMSSPPGLQAFHALVADTLGGGESLFVDGFAVAEHLQRASPRAWHVLSDARRLRLAYKHSDEHEDLRATRGVFELNDRGDAQACFYNDCDRAGAPLVGRGVSVLEALEALRALHAALLDDALLLRLMLRPSTLMIFNNERVLHGREQILGEGRVLAGAYVDADAWRSRLRVLERRHSRT